MPEENFIAASEFCSVHNLASSFVRTLNEYGIIEVTSVENVPFIKASEIPKLQQISRLTHELDINLEGIYTIMHLLQRIKNMQIEIDSLKQKVHHMSPLNEKYNGVTY